MPDGAPLDRIRTTMEQYGMLLKDMNRASAKQKALDVQFVERVTAIKGQAIITMSYIIIDCHNTILCPSYVRV